MKKNLLRMVALVVLLATLTISQVAYSSPLAVASQDWPFGVDFPIADTSENEYQPAVAYNSQENQYLVVWHVDYTPDQEIHAAIIEKDAHVWYGFTVKAATGIDFRNPDVIYNSYQNQYYVVWEQDDGARSNIGGRVVSAQGIPGTEAILGTGVSLRNRFEPAVAYASTANKYLAVWESHVQGALSSDIEGQVVTSSGLLEGQNFLVATGNNTNSYDQADIAYNRSRNEYLVVFRWNDKVAPNYDIRAQRVTRDGILLAPTPITVGYYGLYEHKPAVAALPTTPNNGYYLVVWQADYTSTDGDIYARRVSGDGTLGNYEIVTYTKDINQTSPAVVCNEELQECLVAWTEDYPAPFANYGIRGKKVSISGAGLSAESWIGGLFGRNAALAVGPMGDYLTVFEEQILLGSADILGHLWGQRLFLPMTVR